MAEPVIVATSRTPIGRASKGSLVDARPDDMSAFIVKDVLSKVAGLDPAEVEDIIWGIGQPGGEGGFNIGRIIAVMNEMEVPGVTVNRYCSSSLQTIRMAAHAIKAGEGDCFVAGGVETVSRYMNGAATNPDFDVVTYAGSQVKAALDATIKLGGENYVFWGGREGYETILNTNMAKEMDNLKRFLELVVNYKHKIGFNSLDNKDQFNFEYTYGRRRTIKTVGQKWATFQSVNFNAASQPFYVMMHPNGTLLNTPIQYTDANSYEQWIKKGLQAFDALPKSIQPVWLQN